MPLFSFGKRCASDAAMLFISACACVMDTPGSSLAIT